jgi:hypothetical protein
MCGPVLALDMCAADLPGMSYHEALWVVVGTATPVLGLAKVVGYGTSAEIATSDPLMQRSFKSMTRPLPTRWPHAPLKSTAWYAFVVALGLVGFLVDVTGLLFAGICLAGDIDRIPTWLGVSVLIVSAIVTFLQASINTDLRAFGSGPRRKPNRPDESQTPIAR